MVIDCNSILSRVPPPGAVPVSLHEAAQMWNASGLSGSIRDVSLVGMVVKIQAPRPVKGDLKGKWNTTLWIQDPSISDSRNGDSGPRWGFELTVWATIDSIHRLPRAEPGEILVAYPVKLTGSASGMVEEDSIDERMLVVIPKGAVAKDPRPAPGSVLPENSSDLKWIPENKFVQRLYISALIVPLDNLVDFWAPEESAVSQNGSLSPSVPNSIDSQNRAVILPTRESQDIGRLNATSVINLEGMVTRVRAIQKTNCSPSDPEAIICLIIDVWDGSERAAAHALLERRPNEQVGEEAVCWGRSAVQPYSWRPFLRTCPIHLYGEAIKSAMAQQVMTGTYLRAFSVEMTDQSSLEGPWSIHRGTPRSQTRTILRCTGEAPEGASQGVQVLPSSYCKARHLCSMIMSRSALWLGIPKEHFENFKKFHETSKADGKVNVSRSVPNGTVVHNGQA